MIVEIQSGFLRSRAGRGFLVFVAICAGFSALVGYGFYYSSLRWYEANKVEEKATALALIEAFFSAYSEIRGGIFTDEVPVPESFRAHAIERFNRSRDPHEAMRLVLVGIPGRELRVPPIDADMAEAVRDLATQGDRRPLTRRIEIDGQPFLRTLRPSVASQPSCVSCHNRLQPDQKWQINDVMGAFAADVPLGPFLRTARWEATAIAVLTFVLACAIGLNVFWRQFRRLAHDIQERTRQRLQDAVENLEDGFAIYDAERRLVLCNAAHQRYAGLAPAVDRHPLAHVHDFEHVAGREVALPDDTWIIVREITTRSGDVVRIETDISDLKRREADLRTAKEQAERANRSKSNFLAMMSHELRTPLNAIIGFSEIITDQMMGPVDGRYREYSADIRRSGEHLLSVINDILDMAKIDAEKVELIDGPVDLSFMIDGCIRVVQPRANECAVRLNARLVPGLHVMGDEMRLRQIVLNLLSNGVRFTPPSGAVDVAVYLDGGGDVVVTVTDTGIGMTAEEIPLALAPFEQAASISRRFGGAGLGLSLSRLLTELHGGSLEITSTPGTGTRVALRLPADRVLTEAITLAS